MKLVANKPCTLSGKRYFIGEEIPAEAVADPVALEKMGVLTVSRRQRQMCIRDSYRASASGSSKNYADEPEGRCSSY